MQEATPVRDDAGIGGPKSIANSGLRCSRPVSGWNVLAFGMLADIDVLFRQMRKLVGRGGGLCVPWLVQCNRIVISRDLAGCVRVIGATCTKPCLVRSTILA